MMLANTNLAASKLASRPRSSVRVNASAPKRNEAGNAGGKGKQRGQTPTSFPADTSRSLFQPGTAPDRARDQRGRAIALHSWRSIEGRQKWRCSSRKLPDRSKRL